MNKKQAAEYLGKSPRSIADYVKQGKLKLVYLSGKNGKEASFALSDLEQLKTEMETPIPRVVVDNQSVMKTGAGLVPAADQRLVSLLQAALRPAGAVGVFLPSLVDLNVKPILSLTEVQRLTGIPRERLMVAVNDGSLVGQLGTLGRGWRVKRKDLDAFIEAL